MIHSRYCGQDYIKNLRTNIVWQIWINFLDLMSSQSNKIQYLSSYILPFKCFPVTFGRNLFIKLTPDRGRAAAAQHLQAAAAVSGPRQRPLRQRVPAAADHVFDVDAGLGRTVRWRKASGTRFFLFLGGGGFSSSSAAPFSDLNFLVHHLDNQDDLQKAMAHDVSVMW
jgi:hypothetical protein